MRYDAPMPLVRTAMNPDTEIMVSDGEAAYLEAAGLLATTSEDDAVSTVNIRTTQNPDTVITVSIDEFIDLLAQQLVYAVEGGTPILYPAFSAKQYEEFETTLPQSAGERIRALMRADAESEDAGSLGAQIQTVVDEAVAAIEPGEITTPLVNAVIEDSLSPEAAAAIAARPEISGAIAGALAAGVPMEVVSALADQPEVLAAAVALAQSDAGLVKSTDVDTTNYGFHVGDRLLPVLGADGLLATSLVEGLRGVFEARGSVQALTTPTPATSSVFTKLKGVLNQSLKYNLGTWLPSKWSGTGAIYYLGGRSEEYIRPVAAVALGTAVAVATGTHDATVTGKTDSEARAAAVRLIVPLAFSHKANGGNWGGDYRTPPPNTAAENTLTWQAASWAAMTALAAWLVWGDLDATTRTRVLNLVEWEADRMSDWKLPMWRSRTGTEQYPGDTKSEELAWDAAILAIACTMIPRHARADGWLNKLVEMSVAAFTRPADTTGGGVVNGTIYGDLIDGSNLNDNYTLTNHGIIHPGYAISAGSTLWGVMSAFAASKRVMPAGVQFNAGAIWRALQTVSFAVPPYNAPGGTSYVEDSQEVYFPQGNDWGSNRIIDFATTDVLAMVYGWDAGAPHTAAYWADLHLQKAADMQARSTTGQTYTSAGEDTYSGREQFVTHVAGMAMLALSAGAPRTSASPVSAIATRNRGL